MDWRSPLIALAGALFLSLAPATSVAQAFAEAASCRSAPVPADCVRISGRIVFESSSAPPPTEATVSVGYAYGDGGEGVTIVVRGPDYAFQARIPRRVVPRIWLVDLAAPWLADRVVEPGPVFEGMEVVLRSDAGIPVTATFQYPEGTVAPPAFDAWVSDVASGRTFIWRTVETGQLVAHVRPGSAYRITASPQGFGSVNEVFAARTAAHAVVVPVSRRARPSGSTIRLLEGRGARGAWRNVLLPVPLEAEGPSGGGGIPYLANIEPGSIGVNELVTFSPLTLGRRERFVLVPARLDDDATPRPTRSARLRFLGAETGVVDAPPSTVVVFDDEAADRPPALGVEGVVLIDDSPAPVSAVLARAEGGPGEGWSLRLELDAPAPSGGAAVTVSTVSAGWRDPAVAGPGGDYLPMSQRVVFAAGQREATVRIEGIGNALPQRERRLYLAFTEAEGLVPRDPAIELRILNDDLDGSPHARADRLPVTPLPRSNALDVLANDVVPPDRFAGGRLEILRGPTRGAASVSTQGTASVLDDRILYTPNAGNAGTSDSLRYRLCDALGESCIEARVEIPIRVVPNLPGDLPVATEAGYRDLVFAGLPALPDARAEVLARRVDSRVTGRTAVPDPAERFARPWSTIALPTVTADTPRTMLVALRGEAGTDLDLHVAYDVNDDFRISDDEVLCSPGLVGAVETCVVRFTQRAATPPLLWVAVGNPGPRPVAYHLISGLLDGVGPLPGVAATAPTRIAESEAFPVRLSWRPVAGGNGSAPIIGLLRLRNAAGASLGDLPLVIDWHPPTSDSISGPAAFDALSPVLLRDGESLDVAVPRDARVRDRVFIDVPPGTGGLAITLSRISGATFAPVEAYLARAALPSDGLSQVAVAPGRDAATATFRLDSGSQRLQVVSPPAGRWYLALGGVANGLDALHHVRVTAELITATPAPVVRPGGYFNPSRSGHGLFLYPSGEDWSGLWYTYTQDGAPVWYYLQGAKPGANGIWTAPIYRSGWNGSRNHLTEVGRATITPTAADAFQFTYVLDGELGSEPFTSFGRGCPSIAGRVVDASGHWFDPSRSGTGYSVQLLPNYEFHAVFAYSARGVPRFLVAERNGVGAANEALPLEQLRGFCPLCVRTGAPERATVGVLRREFVNGQLSRINVDAAFTNGTPGTWSVNDAVIPLGGLQGCAAN